MDANQNMKAKLLLRFLVLLVCCSSFAVYLKFSFALRQLLGAWPYHLMLLREAFPPGQLLNSLLEQLPSQSFLPTTIEAFLVLVFAVSCFITGLLARSLLGPELPCGPTLWLFSLGAAIVPPLMLGLILFPDGRGHLSSGLLLIIGLALNACLALALCFQRRRSSPPPVPRFRIRPALNGWMAAFLLPLSALFGIAFLSGSVAVKGTDALAYHVPLAASWYKEGRLAFGYLVQSLLPSDAELLMRWTFIGGSDRYVFLIPFAAAILCLYMIYKIAIAMGQSRPAAVASACCAATLPFFPNLATVAYTDIAGTVFLLISVYFILQWRDSGCLRSRLLGCAGLAMGLSIGTKLSLLPSALVVIALAVTALWRSQAIFLLPPLPTRLTTHSRSLNWRHIWQSLLAFSLPAFLGCGFWLIRNLAVTGNPLFPVGFAGLPGYSPGEIVLIDSVFAGQPWARLALPWNELSFASAYDDGLGAVFAAIVLPALLLWLLIRPRRAEDGSLAGRVIVFWITIGSFALFILSNTTMMRYGIFPLVLSFVFVGELWMALRSQLFKSLTLITYLLMVIMLSQSIMGGYLYSRLYLDRQGAARFSLPEQVDDLAPSRIFNATESFNSYGLMGRDFRHLVITLFRTSLPEDPQAFDADYVLLKREQVPAFLTATPMSEIDRNADGTLSLWRLDADRQREEPRVLRSISDEEDVRRKLERILIRP